MKAKGMEYSLLNKFAGKWKTEGMILPVGNQPEIKIQGTDMYEWLPGGYFLLHWVNVFIGDEKNETLEIIGYDKVHHYYTMQHYDNKGNSGFMKATVVDGSWTFTGDNLRFKGGFNNKENVFSGIWEKSDDGKKWTHFMDIKLTKEI